MVYKEWFNELVMEHTNNMIPTVPTARIWGGLKDGIKVPARRKYTSIPKERKEKE